ncbi:transcriptional regulator with XRE-family HTH domain [Chryseomicrobium aureum]|uniref:helix-turn-helix transcriptional regulator n=1 Tax=Chryseomicrobium aureum TaxID=1441723 RepID=UPI00195E8330|nr:helix-turn-helix transcriptional regulator [Chryseomicrobium aureum]MBM7707602.1 transcriptional regulator with XRE-family HTH domain [Chryseomicrobium aureum]
MENNLIRDLRLCHGMTIEQMANRLGVSKSRISSAESTGNISPKLKALALREFPLNEDFFAFLDQKKKHAELYGSEDYEAHNK